MSLYNAYSSPRLLLCYQSIAFTACIYLLMNFDEHTGITAEGANYMELMGKQTIIADVVLCWYILVDESSDCFCTAYVWLNIGQNYCKSTWCVCMKPFV